MLQNENDYNQLLLKVEHLEAKIKSMEAELKTVEKDLEIIKMADISDRSSY